MGGKFTLEDLLKEVRVTEKTAAEYSEESEKEEVKKEKKKDDDEDEDEDEDEMKEEKAAASKASSPVTDAIKVAEQLANLEKEALTKEANLIGRAIIDGAIARVQEYEKTAMALSSNEEEMTQEKVAHLYNTDPEFRASFDQGYMDKVAEQIENDPEAKKAFIQGYEKTASELIKVAEFMIDRGYSDAGRVVGKLVNQK